MYDAFLFGCCTYPCATKGIIEALAALFRDLQSHPEDASKVVAVLRKCLASSPELLAWLHRIQTEGAAPN